MRDLSYIRHLVVEGRWSSARAEAAGDAVALEYVHAHATRVGVIPEPAEYCDPWRDSGDGYGGDSEYGNGTGNGDFLAEYFRGDGLGGGWGSYQTNGDGHGDDDELSHGQGDGRGYEVDEDAHWRAYFAPPDEEDCHDEYEEYYT